jgi:hypothetical protein
MGDVVQALPPSVSLAMNSAEAQQLFGTAWGVPLLLKNYTYTPPRKFAIAAASASASALSSSHLTTYIPRCRITHVYAPLISLS